MTLLLYFQFICPSDLRPPLIKDHIFFWLGGWSENAVTTTGSLCGLKID